MLVLVGDRLLLLRQVFLYMSGWQYRFGALAYSHELKVLSGWQTLDSGYCSSANSSFVQGDCLRPSFEAQSMPVGCKDPLMQTGSPTLRARYDFVSGRRAGQDSEAMGVSDRAWSDVNGVNSCTVKLRHSVTQIVS